MRNNPGIKYTVPLGGCFAITVIIMMVMLPLFCEGTVSGVLRNGRNLNLAKLTSSAEKAYIRTHKIEGSYSILVTTKNQSRFDRNHDGYLAGKELELYLRKYK